MPDKHPNTHRWGGPGASHEDASKPMPEPSQPRPDDAVGSRPNVSQVSGGGGERDEKHSHVDGMRSSKSHATDSPSPTSTREWRKNRSRNDRERDAQAAAVDEPKSFEPEPLDLEVLVNTDDNVAGHQGLLDHVGGQVGETLRRFAPQLTRVEVHLSDLNAGKSGPADKRCSIEARPKGLAPLAASAEAGTLEAAVSAAATKMVRLLESEFGRRSAKGNRDSIRGSF